MEKCLKKSIFLATFSFALLGNLQAISYESIKNGMYNFPYTLGLVYIKHLFAPSFTKTQNSFIKIKNGIQDNISNTKNKIKSEAQSLYDSFEHQRATHDKCPAVNTFNVIYDHTRNSIKKQYSKSMGNYYKRINLPIEKRLISLQRPPKFVSLQRPPISVNK